MLSWIIIYLSIALVLLMLLGLLIPRIKIYQPFKLIFFLTFMLSLPIVISFVYFAYIINLAPIPEVSVPLVENIPIEEAQQRLHNISLKSKIVSKIQNIDTEEGRIVSQSPEPGQKVKVGRTIGLVVSIGKAKVITPRLIGKQLFQALVILKEHRLEPGEKKESFSKEYESNTVVAHQPTAGEEVDVGTKINLTVAINPEDLNEEIVGELNGNTSNEE